MTITEQLEKEIERIEFEKFKNGLKQDLFLIVNLGIDMNIENKIKKRKKFLNDFEKEVEEAYMKRDIMTIREQLEAEMDEQEIKELEGNSVDDNKECNKMDNSNTGINLDSD